MLNNNLNGGIDLMNLLFEYISFDNVQLNNFNYNYDNSSRMNLKKYVQTNHKSGEIKLKSNDKLMHHIHVSKEEDCKANQDNHRHDCYKHFKKLECKRRELKIYGGMKCTGDFYDYDPFDYDYTNYNEPHNDGLVFDSIFETLCINKTSINKMINCWVPVYRQCYYHDISFVDANGKYQGARCKGHSDYTVEYFPLLNILPRFAFDYNNYKKQEKLKKLYTKWIIDRCEFRDKVLKLKLKIDTRDCVYDVRRFVGKINKINEKHKQLVKLNQFEIDYNNSLQNYFERTANCSINVKYWYHEFRREWYPSLNEYSYDMVTWFDYNKNENLFCKKNQIFIKRQKSKQIEYKKYFKRNNNYKYKYKCIRRYNYNGVNNLTNKDKTRKQQKRKLKQKCKQWTRCKTVYDENLLAFV